MGKGNVSPYEYNQLRQGMKARGITRPEADRMINQEAQPNISGSPYRHSEDGNGKAKSDQLPGPSDPNNFENDSDPASRSPRVPANAPGPHHHLRHRVRPQLQTHEARKTRAHREIGASVRPHARKFPKSSEPGVRGFKDACYRYGSDFCLRDGPALVRATARRGLQGTPALRPISG